MQAFHGKQEVKDFYVQRLREHHDRHELWSTELGLPEWYAYLCDKIFENLPKEKAPAFAVATLLAIPVGVDIEPVRWQLAIARHQRDLGRLKDVEPYVRRLRKAIQGVIDYCNAMLAGTATEKQRIAAM